MLILTYIFLYSGVFLHLKPTKPGEKNNNAFPYFIFCEPPFNTGEQILQEIFFLSLFFQQSIFELAAQRHREKNCIATKFSCTMYSTKKFSQQSLLNYYSDSKQKKQPVKTSMPFFFSIQLLCFPESLYIISSTDQSLFGFFFTNIENYSELLGSYFYRLILKKNPKTIQQTHFVSFMLLEQKSTVC